MSSNDTVYQFNVAISGSGVDETQILMPMLMMGGNILGAVLAMLSVYLLWKYQPMHFMMTACYISIMICSILYFELFGIYIVLGLQFNPKYFQYLTISGIACFISSLATNKLSVIFFLYQYANHPQIDNTSWSSPRTKYYVITIVTQLTFYLGAFFMCRYPAFTYYVLPFYFFPLFHIGNCILKKTKVTFKFYFQWFLWFPVIIHAVFIRGYDRNFLGLTPWNKMQYIVPIAMLIMIALSYLQSIFGPLFFFPKRFLPGHHTYKTAITALPPNQQSEECPICYTPINQCLTGLPTDPVECISGELREPLAEKKADHCYSTPCKHRFHPQCLSKWFEKKPDCPVCRKALPYLD